MEKTWNAPVIEELTIAGGTEGGVIPGLNDDFGVDDGSIFFS